MTFVILSSRWMVELEFIDKTLDFQHLLEFGAFYIKIVTFSTNI